MARVHLIAEAGTNHGGKRETAEKLVDIAVAAGSDSVKFQLIYPEGLYLPRFFQNGSYADNEVFKKRAAAMLSDDDYRRLAAYAKEKKIPFTASIFDRRGIDLLDSLDVPYFKVASCDLNNSGLLRAAAERKRMMVISTGMSTLGEIERAVADITATGNTKLAILHCVSIYPCPSERSNLGFLTTLKKAFGFPVGYSDHTESSVAAVAAVALGAEWIEKHFTYDRKAEGFDHAYAMEPGPFAQYVRDLRSASEALAPASPKVGEAESTVRKRARRSLYAARDLKAGEVLKEADVLVVRPEGPLAPNDLPLVLGKTLRKAVRQHEVLTLESFGVA